MEIASQNESSASLYHAKIKAVVAHLILSIVIFSGIMAILISFWYPPPYFEMDGGWQGIKLVAFIDIVLGPLLTFVVFKPGKKGLKVDLALIAVLQFSALFYGIHTLYTYRTAAMVFAYDAFYVLSADVYKNRGIPWSTLDEIPGDYPKKIFLSLPEGQNIKSFLKLSKENPEFTLAVDNYRSLDGNMEAIIDMGRDIAFHLNEVPEDQGPVDDFLAEYGGTLDDYAFLPVYARYYFYLIGVDRESKEIVGVMKVQVPYPKDIPYLKETAKIKQAAST